MADFVDITDSQIEPEKPVTTPLLAALRDNPIAIAEGDENAPRVKPVIIHVRDEKAAGTDGGTFNANVWNTRTLNTVKTNDIVGASLASNRVTLPAGVYECWARAPGFNIAQNKSRLRNITDGVDVLIGTGVASAVASSESLIRGRFTIVATKQFELQHQSTQTTVNTGNGIAIGMGLIEIYAELIFTKIG